MRSTTPATSSRKARATPPATWPSGAGASRVPKCCWASATPSLESWYASRPSPKPGGRYLRLDMPSRIGAAALPSVRLVDMRQQPRSRRVCARLCCRPSPSALAARRAKPGAAQPPGLCAGAALRAIAAGKATARTAAPTRSSTKATAPCAATIAASPSACPAHCPHCGNPDIRALGRGTEQLRRSSWSSAAQRAAPRWPAARVAPHRCRHHPGRRRSCRRNWPTCTRASVDVLVGTQMIAKGHDFRRITLVAAIAPRCGAV